MKHLFLRVHFTRSPAAPGLTLSWGQGWPDRGPRLSCALSRPLAILAFRISHSTVHRAVPPSFRRSWRQTFRAPQRSLRASRMRRMVLRVSTSRSDRSAAFPGSSATAAQAYQVDGAISRTQFRPALADGLRRLRSQNLPDRRTRHRQILADPLDQTTLPAVAGPTQIPDLVQSMHPPPRFSESSEKQLTHKLMVGGQV